MDMSVVRATLYSQSANRVANRPSDYLVFDIALYTPFALIGAFVGWYFARHGQNLPILQASQSVLMLSLGLALMSGVWDGTYTIRFESFQAFQVGTLDLFLAELCSSLNTSVRHFMWVFGGSFCLGAVIGAPKTGLLCLLLFPQWMLGQVCLERIFGLFARTYARHVRLFGLLLFPYLCMLLFRHFKASGTIPDFMFPNLRLLEWLPTTQAAHAVMPGNSLVSGLAQVGLASVWTILVLLATLGLTWNDFSGVIASTSGFLRNVGLFRFDAPWVGVAKLRWLDLWNSKHGRFFLFLPLFSFEGILFPHLLNMHPPSTWYVAIMAFLTFPVGASFALNIFAYDGSKLRGYWSLPLSDSDFLLGKAAGSLAYFSIFAVFHVGCISIATSLSLPQVFNAILLCYGIFLANLAFGIPISIRFPRPVDPKSLAPSSVNKTLFLKLGLCLLPALVLVVVWQILSPYGNWPITLAMMLACGLSLAQFFRSLPRTCALLYASRDHLTAAMERQDAQQ